MAYRRYKRRRFSRRRKVRRSRRARMNRRTGGLLGIEKKYQDCGTNPGDLGSLGCFFYGISNTSSTFPALAPVLSARYSAADVPFNAIPLQDGPNGRENRKVALQSLLCEGSVCFPGSVTDLVAGYNPLLCGTMTVCIAIVLDTQSNGSTPSGSDIWQVAPDYIGSATGSWAAMMCTPQRNMANTDRFKVLKFLRFQYIPEWDLVKSTTTGTGTTTTSADRWAYIGCRQYFKFKLNLKGLVTSYSPTSTTPVTAAIRDNAIWGFSWCWMDWDTTYADISGMMRPFINMSTRLRFYG